MTRARMRRENEFPLLPIPPRGSASEVPGATTKRPPFSMMVGRKGEMRDLKSVEELQAKFRAKAKAAKAGTMRAKALKRIDDLQRVYAETAWVQRYYCTQFRFWRLCSLAPCRRARACKGDADACLKRSVDQVPRHEIWQTRQKLLEATPRHFGAVERKVRQTWPTEFWPRPVDWELVRTLAEAKRQRQLDKEWFAQIHPCGPDGLVPRRR